MFAKRFVMEKVYLLPRECISELGADCWHVRLGWPVLSLDVSVLTSHDVKDNWMCRHGRWQEAVVLTLVYMHTYMSQTLHDGIKG